MFLVDSCRHPNGLDYQSLCRSVDDALAKTATRSMKFCLTVTTALPGYCSMCELVGECDNVVFSCDVHPPSQGETYDIENLCHSTAKKGVVAIGKTGLDYFYTPGTKVRQQESFIHHIRIGRGLQRSVIMYTRDARTDTLSILREERMTDYGGVLHCFTGGRETVDKLLDLGFYISFSDIVTFRSAEQLYDAVHYIPLGRLLVKTDSPYLAPVPHRGKEDQPAVTRGVAGCMAVAKGITIEELAQTTTDNFARLLHIDVSHLQSAR